MAAELDPKAVGRHALAWVAVSLACAGACELFWRISPARAIVFSFGFMAGMSAGGVALSCGSRLRDRRCLLAAGKARGPDPRRMVDTLYYHCFIRIEPPS